MAQDSFLTRKLRHGAQLKAADIERLNDVVEPFMSVAAGEDLIQEDDNPKFVHFVKSGIICRYKQLSNGNRAIVALLLPGDFCDLHIHILGHMDHSLGALTESEVSRIAANELHAMLEGHPAINRACLWSTLVDEAILREWLVNVGRRSSEQQLAHLFCELYTRLHAVGLAVGHIFSMPFTQATLADLLGITPVHVQRTMARLRDAGRIVVQNRNIRLLDFDALAELAEFDPVYLHLRTRELHENMPNRE